MKEFLDAGVSASAKPVRQTLAPVLTGLINLIKLLLLTSSIFATVEAHQHGHRLQ